MKYLFFLLVIGSLSCSNPYVTPQSSAAVSIKEQTELFKKQNELLQQQNEYLRRIAEALEKGKGIVTPGSDTNANISIDTKGRILSN